MSNATIKPGTEFNATYADGNPRWSVTRPRGKGVWEAKVISPDFPGTVKVFTTEEILRSLNWDEFFKKHHDDSMEWYNAQPVGRIVHYNNGFKDFIRCRIVEVPEEMSTETRRSLRKGYQKALLPIALVGEWGASNLPHRRPDGTVDLGYHGRKIQEKEIFTPDITTIFEATQRDHWNVDPTTMPEIDLNLPAMTSEQEKVAKQHQLINEMRQTLDNCRDPRVCLLAIAGLAEKVWKVV